MTPSNPDRRILRRLDSRRPRVQETAGRAKLRNGLARCRVQLALPRCPAEGFWSWRNVPFIGTQSVQLQLPVCKAPSPEKSVEISPSGMVDPAAAALNFRRVLRHKDLKIHLLAWPWTSVDCNMNCCLRETKIPPVTPLISVLSIALRSSTAPSKLAFQNDGCGGGSLVASCTHQFLVVYTRERRRPKAQSQIC